MSPTAITCSDKHDVRLSNVADHLDFMYKLSACIFIYTGTAAAAALFLPSAHVDFAKHLLSLQYGIIAASAIGLCLVPILDFPLVEDRSGNSGRLATLYIISMLGVAAVAAWDSLAYVQPTASSHRIAMLLTGVLALSVQLVRVSQHAASHERFADVRRRLLLNELDDDTAFHILGQYLSGMRISDYLEPYTSRLAREFSAQQLLFERELAKVNRAVTTIEEADPTSLPSVIDLARPILDSSGTVPIRRPQLKDLEIACDRYLRVCKFLLWVGVRHTHMKDSLNSIRASVAKLSALHTELVHSKQRLASLIMSRDPHSS